VTEAAMRLFAERGVTHVTISELAEAAGVARGTLYNHGVEAESLFETIATQLTEEMTLRIDATLTGVTDPAERIAMGMRLFVRRASEEPTWGRFVTRFSASHPTVRALLAGGPAKDLDQAMRKKRVKVRADQIMTSLSMMSGSVLAAMLLVLEGMQTWREAGSSTAELYLRALGVQQEEARAISRRALPELAAR
jgi:AcrR family transcriptional regulator